MRWHPAVPGHLYRLIKPPSAAIPHAQLLSAIWHPHLEICHFCLWSRHVQLTSMWQHKCIDIYHWIPLSRRERWAWKAQRASIAVVSHPAADTADDVPVLSPLAQALLLCANGSHWLVCQISRGESYSEISMLHANSSLYDKIMQLCRRNSYLKNKCVCVLPYVSIKNTVAFFEHVSAPCVHTFTYMCLYG